MQTILIGLDTRINNYASIDLMQGYNYTLEAHITDNYKDVDLTGVTVQLQMQKPDKKFIIQTENITIEGNKIKATLDKDFTREDGQAKLQVVLLKDNFTFGSWVVKVKIKPSAINDNDGQSENKVTITEALVNKISEAENTKIELDKSIANGDVATIKGNVDKIKDVEIPKINEQLDTIENVIREYVSIENFDKINVETNDTQRFKRAMEYCVQNNFNLKLANKTYVVNTDALVWVGTYNIKGEGIGSTKIIVDDSTTGGTIINTNEVVTIKGGSISNLTIDGKGKAVTGIKVFGKKNIFHKIKIINCTGNCMLLGYTDAPIPTWETQISECILSGRENDGTGVLPQYALVLANSATDNFIINTIVTNTSESPVRDRGSNNRFQNVHTYGYADNNRPKYSFLLEGNLSSLVNCQLDTPKTAGVLIKGYSNKIIGCSLFWTSTFPNVGTESFIVLDNSNEKASGNISVGNNFSIIKAMTSVIKIIGSTDNLYFQSIGNSGNGGDNGNTLFIHPDNTLVSNVFGKWYNPFGIDRSLANKESALVLSNNWVNFDTTGGSNEATVKYSHIGNVELKGRISGGTETNGTTIFTLSSIFRPTKYTCISVTYRTNTDEYKIGELGIGTGGNVSISGVTNCKYIMLDGISFPK